MALPEDGVLGDALNNLRNVMAEHLPYRVLCPHQLHKKRPPEKYMSDDIIA